MEIKKMEIFNSRTRPPLDEHIAESLEDHSKLSRALATKLSCHSLSNQVPWLQSSITGDSLFTSFCSCCFNWYHVPFPVVSRILLTHGLYFFTAPAAHNVSCFMKPVYTFHDALFVFSASIDNSWFYSSYSNSPVENFLAQFIAVKTNLHHLSREKLPSDHNSDTYPSSHQLQPGPQKQTLRMPKNPQGCFHPQKAVCVAGRQHNRLLSKTFLPLGIFISERACYVKQRTDYCTREAAYYTQLPVSEISGPSQQQNTIPKPCPLEQGVLNHRPWVYLQMWPS